MRNKLLFLFLLLACFVLGNNNQAIAASKYRISHLSLDKTYSYAYCINNNGEVSGVFDIAVTETSEAYMSSFYWNGESGVVELPLGKHFTPNGINDFGLIVGQKSITRKKVNGSHDSWLEGSLISLQGDNENWKNFQPRSINNQNYIVGGDVIRDFAGQSKNMNIYTHLNLKEKYKRTDKYKNKGYSYKVYALSINNKNEVVGNIIIHKETLIGHGFLWSNERVLDFGEGYNALDINDYSQVILTTEFTKNPSSWFWENGDFVHMWDGGKASAINNHGTVVGFKMDGAAVVWEKGKTSLLYDLLENPEGWWKLCIAEDINDRGEIVGYGIYNGKATAFLLTPCE